MKSLVSLFAIACLAAVGFTGCVCPMQKKCCPMTTKSCPAKPSCCGSSSTATCPMKKAPSGNN